MGASRHTWLSKLENCAPACLWQPASGATHNPAVRYLHQNSKDISGIITYSLGFALILTSIAVLIRSYLQRHAPPLSNESSVGRFGDKQLPYTVFTGFVLGVL